METAADTPQDTTFLREAFGTEQTCLVASLKSSQRITHAGDRGEVNEQHFIEFLLRYLPNRYTVEKAIRHRRQSIFARWQTVSAVPATNWPVS